MQLMPTTIRKSAIFFFCILFYLSLAACESSSTSSNSETDGEASSASTNGGTEDGSEDGSDGTSEDGSEDGSDGTSEDGSEDGSTDDPSGFVGSCEQDGEEAFMAALGNQGGPSPLQTCMGTCAVGAEASGDCLVECLDENTELSEDCLHCFGDFSGCVGLNCADECSETGAPEDCEICINTSSCLEALFECSDLDISEGGGPGGGPGPEGDGACTNPEDGAALAAMDEAEEDIFGICGEQCFNENDSAQCAKDCFSDLMETSDECTACFGEFFGCILTECSECSDAPGSMECNVCVAETCEETFFQCAGFQLGGEEETDAAGACANPDDALALETGGDIVGDCVQSCLEDDDMEDCVVACLGDESALSEDCAGCYAESIMCLMENCALECDFENEDDDNDACFECMTEEDCFSDFEECAGSSLIGGMDEGACINSDDMDMLQMMGEIGEMAFSECTASCANADNINSCAAECFAGYFDTSPGCSGCFGDMLECSLELCADPCADGMSEECQMCSDSYCGEDFNDCAGFYLGEDPETGQGGGGDGACMNMEDMEIVGTSMGGAEGEASPLEICGASCASEDDIAVCASDCIAEYTGMSFECASCFGDILETVTEKCPACLGGEDEEACQSCMESENVGEEFFDCAGFFLDGGGPVDVIPGEGSGGGPGGDWGDGACMNEEDMAFLDSMDNQSEEDGCMKTCMEEDTGSSEDDQLAVCVAECLVSEEGVSEECADCFGEMMACLAYECQSECMGGDGSQDSSGCDTCLDTTCQPAFISCAGFPDDMGPQGSGGG